MILTFNLLQRRPMRASFIARILLILNRWTSYVTVAANEGLTLWEAYMQERNERRVLQQRIMHFERRLQKAWAWSGWAEWYTRWSSSAQQCLLRDSSQRTVASLPSQASPADSKPSGQAARLSSYRCVSGARREHASAAATEHVFRL